MMEQASRVPKDIKAHPTILYLIRHASPDWTRVEIPYDVPPGPPLTASGRQEAHSLGLFVKSVGITKVYYSPLERTAATAQIAAEFARIPALEWAGLAEWKKGEAESEIRARLGPLLETAITESSDYGPIGLVTHGSPVAWLLKELGMEPDRLEKHRGMFDHANPLPPAGVWSARLDPATHSWVFALAFTPASVTTA